MFCPLCKAEYRAGFDACSTCGARLAGDAPEAERHPPLVYWESSDRKGFDEVVALLREAGIPCYEKAQFDHWLYAIRGRKPQLHLILLQRDAEQARQATGLEFRAYPPAPVFVAAEGTPLQTCPFCAAEFPAGMPRCPSCGGDLLAWEPRKAPEAPAPLDASDTLVPPLPAGGNGDDPDKPELVWHGGDPVMFSRAVEVLRENQIFHHTRSTSDHFAFQMGMPRPMLEIRVRTADAEPARELLAEWQPSLPLVPQEPPPPEAALSDVAAQDATAPVAAVSEVATQEAEFVRRKSLLRWGLGLLFFAFLLIWWLSRLGPPWFTVFVDLFSRRQGETRLLAVAFLVATNILCTIVSLILLYFSWARRLDKIGLLSWFFGFQGILSLALIASWVLK